MNQDDSNEKAKTQTENQNAKELKEREKAIRKTTMERQGQTKKRNPSESLDDSSKEKRCRSSTDTLELLRNKMEADLEVKRQE